MRRVSIAVLCVAALVAIPGTAAASTYTNPGLISIPESTGPATPYPSTITVSDLPGTVTKVRATLHNTSHAWPENLEVLLQAPNGKTTALIVDVCGESEDEIVNQTFTFDDAAPTELIEVPPPRCVAGTYRPSAPDVFLSESPSPAPLGIDTAAMSVLNGSPAIGTWKLFAFDEACCDDQPPENQIAGWSIDLLTNVVCSENTATLTGTAGDDELLGTEQGDVILGFGGNDTIRGLGGNDVVCGGEGKDTIRGGANNDRLIGEAGKDTLRGQGGKDRLLGKGGKDKLNGGTSRDVCKGGKKDDTAKKCEVEKSI